MTATQTRLRRDTLTNLNAATPAGGELGVNTTDNRVHLGDGVTAGGIPLLSYPDDIKSYFHFATTTGSANAYVLTLPYAPTAYTTGMRIKFKASFSCTGSATINVNSLGAKTFKKVSSGALTALSSGDIISGVTYQAIYDGTDFQIFGVTPTLQTPGSVLLGTATASASATLDFTSLITSTYDTYDFVLKQLRVSTINSQILLRTSTNNGSTYDAGTGYVWTNGKVKVGASPSIAYTGTGTDGSIELVDVTDNAAGDATSGILTIVNPLNATAFKMISWDVMYQDSSVVYNIKGTGYRNSTADIDAIRFLPSTGTFTSGEIDVYGRTA